MRKRISFVTILRNGFGTSLPKCRPSQPLMTSNKQTSTNFLLPPLPPTTTVPVILHPSTPQGRSTRLDSGGSGHSCVAVIISHCAKVKGCWQFPSEHVPPPTAATHLRGELYLLVMEAPWRRAWCPKVNKENTMEICILIICKDRTIWTDSKQNPFVIFVRTVSTHGNCNQK